MVSDPAGEQQEEQEEEEDWHWHQAGWRPRRGGSPGRWRWILWQSIMTELAVGRMTAASHHHHGMSCSHHHHNRTTSYFRPSSATFSHSSGSDRSMRSSSDVVVRQHITVVGLRILKKKIAQYYNIWYSMHHKSYTYLHIKRGLHTPGWHYAGGDLAMT